VNQQLPHLPEDETEAAPRTRFGPRSIIGFIVVILVVTTMIVLHLTGVIEPGGH
jgi:hypothetical protein